MAREGNPLVRVDKAFKEKLDELRRQSGKTTSQITKGMLILFFVLLFFPLVQARQYANNYSFEDSNNGIIDQCDAVNIGCSKGYWTYGWDKQGSSDSAAAPQDLMSLVSASATVGTHVGSQVVHFVNISAVHYWMHNYGMTSADVNTGLKLMINPGQTKIACMDLAFDMNPTVGTAVKWSMGLDHNFTAMTSYALVVTNASNQILPVSSGTDYPMRKYCYALKNNWTRPDTVRLDMTSQGNGTGDYTTLMDNFYLEDGIVFGDQILGPEQAFGDSFTLHTKVLWDGNGETLHDANVSVNFTTPVTGIKNYFGTYNASTGYFDILIPGTIFPLVGTYNYTVDANLQIGGANTAVSSNGSVNLSVPEYKYLTLVPISNVASWRYGSIEVTPANETSNIIFRIDSNASIPVDMNLGVINSDRSGKQYSIYTANALGYATDQWTFQDSTTFGTNQDPVQKIWDSSTNKYRYSFQDILDAGESRYYKLVYSDPLYYFANASASGLVNNLAPTDVNLGSLVASQFTVSEIANIKTWMVRSVPITFGDLNMPYEVQFTARVDNNTSATLYIADFDVNSNTTTSIKSISLTSGYQTFGVPYTPQKVGSVVVIYSNETYPKSISLYDFRVVQRDYFAFPLTVTDEFLNEFPSLVLGGTSVQYVIEGEKARLQTRYNDKDGNISEIRYQAYLDGNLDANLGLQEIEPATGGANSVNDLDHTMQGLYDLTPSGPVRSLQYRVSLVDSDGHIIAVQSKMFKYLQWPYFPRDLELGLTLNGTLVGDHPAGTISIHSLQPDNINAVYLRFLDENASFANPNYAKLFTKDIDFVCHGTDCSFDFSDPTWAIPKATHYLAYILVLTKTEQSFVLPYNPLLVYQRYFLASKRELEALGLVEAFPKDCNSAGGIFNPLYCDLHILAGRTFKVYRSYEEIPVVLVARSQTKENLHNYFAVNLAFVRCTDDSVTCTGNQLDSNYYTPDSFYYDDINGNNYWFFDQTPFNLLDGNYYRIMGTVTDKKNQFNIPGSPVLTEQSATVLQYAPDNNANEMLIKIDDTNLINAPIFLVHGCVKYDVNTIVSSFDNIDITCVDLIKHGNTPISRMDVTLGNENSDYAEENPLFKQFVSFSLNRADLYYANLTTIGSVTHRVLGTTCADLGCVMNFTLQTMAAQYFNGQRFVQADYTSLVSDYLGNSLATVFALIFEPQNLMVVSYTMHGVNVMNVAQFPQFKDVDRSEAIRYAIENNLWHPTTNHTIDVYVNAKKIKTLDANNSLVIDAQQSTVSVRTYDGNVVGSMPNPQVARFTLNADAVYNSGLQTVRRSVPFIFAVDITTQNLFGLVFDTIGQFIANPWTFFVQRIPIIVILLALLFVISIIYANLGLGRGRRSSGGIHIDLGRGGSAGRYRDRYPDRTSQETLEREVDRDIRYQEMRDRRLERMRDIQAEEAAERDRARNEARILKEGK